MICGTFLGKTLEPYRSDKGDLYGATVAENQLVRATLEADSTLRCEFWKPGLELSVTKNPEFFAATPDLSHLRRQFERRILLRALPSLPSAEEAAQYVFVGGVPLLPVFADLREQLSPNRMPICAILHAACFPELAWQFARILMSADPCDAIVATSRAGRQAVEGGLDAGIEKVSRRLRNAAQDLIRPRIVQIPLGTDIPREDALDHRRARSVLNLPASSFCALYIGRLTQGYKADLDVLVEAVGRLATPGRDVRLILAGQSPSPAYIAHLEAHLGGLNLSERAVIIKDFPEFLKPTLLAACDVFVSPVDSIQETFGIAVVEAMAHARPVVATSWSGYRDLIVDGETGFLLKTKWSAESAKFLSTYSTLLTPPELADYLAQRTVIDVEELAYRLHWLAANPEAAPDDGMARQIPCYRALLVAVHSQPIFGLVDRPNRARAA
jgi:glycosyltransferase involved in cell wall biosynthesis